MIRKNRPRPQSKNTIATPSTLLEELVERTRLSWLQITLVVGLAMILFLVGVAYLSGILAAPFDAVFWQNGMLYPAIVSYILLMQPFLRRLRDTAIRSFRPLTPVDDDSFQRLLAEASIFNRRREWLALVIGIVGMTTILWRPWDYAGPSKGYALWGGRSDWLALYTLVAGALMDGLMIWSIYSSLSGTRLFTELQRHSLNINIFDLRPLVPIGHWSLGIALFYIGGAALSLLFMPQFITVLTIESAILYGTLILTPVLVFFLNMLGTRQAIVAAKKRKLDVVRDHLAAAYRAMEEQAAQGEAKDLEAMANSVVVWAAYEQRVKQVPEWPYTTAIRRNLVLSMLLPFAAPVLKQMLLNLALQLLPSAR